MIRFFRLCKKIIHIFGNSVKLTDLKIFSDKSLHHTGRIYVFLNRIIQHIILVKHLDEVGMGFLCNKDKGSAKKRNHDQE